MNPFLIIVLIITTAFLATTLLFLIIKLIDILLGLRAPYIGVDPEAIPKIAKLLGVSGQNQVYDLGSGDGRVLIGLAKSASKARFTGYDIGFLPTLTARRNVRAAGLYKVIKLVRANFLHQDLSDADRIFTYLFPGLMVQLEQKLSREVKSGTLLVSCDYLFPNKKPIRTMRLKQDQMTRCHTLYLYKF